VRPLGSFLRRRSPTGLRSTSRRSLTAKENRCDSVAMYRLTVASLRRYCLRGMISPAFLSFRGLPRVKFSPRSVARFRGGGSCYLGDALAGKLLGPPVELKRAGSALHLVEFHQDRLRVVLGERVETGALCGGVRKVPPFAGRGLD
jgi:hypothetical protein